MYKRVLCVCSGGILRSATLAWLLGQEPYNCNTRACGVEVYALIKVTPELCEWADVIFCMTAEHELILNVLKGNSIQTPVICLDVPDVYMYRQVQLIELLKDRLKERAKDIL